MIKKIDKFCLSEHTNNLYKKEASSSIALARDVAGKINELIDEFNNFVEQKWEKIHEQDGTIRKAIIYMKDNLLNSINELLDIRGVDLIDNSVREYLGTLQAQLDNLISGSTSDGELIDIRVGVDGTTYKTAGESVRGEIQKRTCYTGVMVAGNINSEYVVNNHVSLSVEKIHVFYNGYRYDVLNVNTSLSLSEPHELFNILFNLKNKSISLALSTTKINPEYVMIGCIFKDKVKFNEYSFSNNYYADSIKPLIANAWSDIQPHIIKIDNNNFKLVLNANVVIFYDGKGILINKGEFDLYTNSTTTLFYLTYDPGNSTISLLPWGNYFPLNKIAFGLFNIYQGVYLFGANNRKQEKNLGVLLPSISGKYIEFDNINKIITFPNDTLILSNLPNYYYQLSETKNNNVVSYSHQTSSALCVYYNIITDSLEVLKYSDIATQNLILLATFRTSTGIVSTTLPWKWNNIPYNLTIENNVLTQENVNIKSINHRGYSEAPENTLAAYKLSAKNGFKYVECDVNFTSDNIPVLLHDDTIDRTSNGTGNITNLTFNQVRSYDFGSWKSISYTGEKIPSFEEFISLCKKLGLHPYIELKNGTESQINILINIVKKYGMINNVSWISFSSTSLNYVFKAHNQARIGLIVNSIDNSVITTIKALKGNNEVFIDCNYTNITESSINLCINENIPVEIWTLNDESVALTLNPYISGVSSDNLHIGKILYNNNI